MNLAVLLFAPKNYHIWLERLAWLAKLLANSSKFIHQSVSVDCMEANQHTNKSFYFINTISKI